MSEQPVKVLDFSKAELEKVEHQNQYLIIWLDYGKVLFHVNNSPVHLQKGTICFVKPAQTLEISQESENIGGTVILFQEQALATLPDAIRTNIFKNLGLIVFFSLDDEERETCNMLKNNLLTEFSTQKLLSQEMVLSLFSQLTITLTRIRVREIDLAEVDSDRYAQLFVSFIELVEKDYKKRPTISQVAEKLAISERHLSRVARACSGLSPHEIIESRINLEAIRLLSKSSSTVSQIGFELGFSEPSYFNEFFKRINGATPGNYRMS